MSGPSAGSAPGPRARTADRPVPRAALLSTFLRSFTIQGSWNYRTMVGAGFAWALLPALRALAGARREPLEETLGRHAEHFNAHPYLTSLALGATVRMEGEGEDPDTIHRFKAAIRGPLGGLGDTLVWAAWLPTTLLAALLAAWAGLPSGLCVALFLVLYNLGHLALRVWGFGAGLEAGKRLGSVLQGAHLARVADRVSTVGTVLVGALAGLIVAVDPGFREPAWLWVPLGLAAAAAGVAGGHRVWRPAAVVVVVTVGALTVIPWPS